MSAKATASGGGVRKNGAAIGGTHKVQKKDELSATGKLRS